MEGGGVALWGGKRRKEGERKKGDNYSRKIRENKTLKSGGFSRKYETKKENNSRGVKRRERN